MLMCSGFIFLLLESRTGRERERNTNQLPPACALARAQTQILGVCPDGHQTRALLFAI